MSEWVKVSEAAEIPKVSEYHIRNKVFKKKLDVKHERGKWFTNESLPVFDAKGREGETQGAVITDSKSDDGIAGHEAGGENTDFIKNCFDAVLNSVDEGIIATNLDGKIVLINKTAERLTGWTSHETIGRHLNEIFHVLDKSVGGNQKDTIEKVLATGEAVNLSNDTILISKNGTEHNISDGGFPIRNSEGQLFGAVILFRENAIESTKDDDYKLMADVVNGIAHDFNNIITGISDNINLIKDCDKLEGEGLERLVRIENATLRAKDLARRLLRLYKGEKDNIKTISIAGLLKESASFLLAGSNVRYELMLADDLWKVKFDEAQMDRVISNIITNANQAMPKGGTIRIRAENVNISEKDCLPLKDGKYVKVSIEDQGIGISEENLQKIFKPYFTTKSGGNGLGLVTSYSIIKNHGGQITVESHSGTGTTFNVYIPALPEEVEEEFMENRGKILVMDDEEIIRDIISKMLKRMGYEVFVTADGAEAVELYKSAKDSNQPFDAVVVDLTVPEGMGGDIAVGKILDIDPDAKVIASSGYYDSPIASKFEKYGFVGFIPKPYNTEELTNILRKILAPSLNNTCNATDHQVESKLESIYYNESQEQTK